MVKKFLALALFIVVIALSPLSAAMVSFLVIESGQLRGSTISRQVGLWEDNLSDIFFESGHIVSNAPALQLPHKPEEGFPSEAERDFIDARNGGMDYFVIVIIDHPAPHNASIRLFSTSSPEILFEHTHTARIYGSLRDENEAIKNSIITLSAHLR